MEYQPRHRKHSETIGQQLKAHVHMRNKKLFEAAQQWLSTSPQTSDSYMPRHTSADEVDRQRSKLRHEKRLHDVTQGAQRVVVALQDEQQLQRVKRGTRRAVLMGAAGAVGLSGMNVASAEESHQQESETTSVLETYAPDEVPTQAQEYDVSDEPAKDEAAVASLREAEDVDTEADVDAENEVQEPESGLGQFSAVDPETVDTPVSEEVAEHETVSSGDEVLKAEAIDDIAEPPEPEPDTEVADGEQEPVEADATKDTSAAETEAEQEEPTQKAPAAEVVAGLEQFSAVDPEDVVPTPEAGGVERQADEDEQRDDTTDSQEAEADSSEVQEEPETGIGQFTVVDPADKEAPRPEEADGTNETEAEADPDPDEATQEPVPESGIEQFTVVDPTEVEEPTQETPEQENEAPEPAEQDPVAPPEQEPGDDAVEGEEQVEEPKKTNIEIAEEVLDDKWGRDEDRKVRLTEAGYDYEAVQEEVNKILNERAISEAEPSPIGLPAAANAPWLFSMDRPAQDALREKYGAVSGKLDPSELTTVEAPWRDKGMNEWKLSPGAAEAFTALNAEFTQRTGQSLCITQTYRSYEQQKQAKADHGKFAATPGSSNHGWGDAIDFCDPKNPNGAFTRDTEAYKVLEEIAPKYGFVNPHRYDPRYSEFYEGDSKQIDEPWHWEFVEAYYVNYSTYGRAAS